MNSGDGVEHVVEAAVRRRIAFAGDHQQALVAPADQLSGVALDAVHVEAPCACSALFDARKAQ